MKSFQDTFSGTKIVKEAREKKEKKTKRKKQGQGNGIEMMVICTLVKRKEDTTYWP